MRRSTLFAVMLPACGATHCSPHCLARAAEYGAIAWDKQIGKRSWSSNQPTQKRADEAASGECGASGCKVIIRTGSGMCAASAIAPRPAST